MPESLIWILDDDDSIRWVLERALGRAGYRVESLASVAQLRDALAAGTPDLLFCDVRLPDGDGLALLREIRADHPDLPAVVMTAYSDFETTMAAFDAGALEHLPKPFDVDDLLALTRRCLTGARRQTPDATPDSEARLLGQAAAMQPVFRAIGRLARTHAPVLITGESGTGKELVARALHRHSPRSRHAFVALNAAAIPPDLLESELFGHERGAFTGAHQRRAGRFEQADGGTLFLDEIGDMPPSMQTRLLRVLAEGEFYRVGGHEAIRVDVRVVAATHQDLEAAVAAGRFREDLYHRLNVVRVEMPPLRQRIEDIGLFTERFLAEAADEFGVAPKHFAPAALERLQRYSWPGNVRELRNLCRRLTVMAPSAEIGSDDLPALTDDAVDSWQQLLRAEIARRLENGESAVAQTLVAELEQLLLDVALTTTDGHRQRAAECLGWGRNTVTRKLRDYNLG